MTHNPSIYELQTYYNRVYLCMNSKIGSTKWRCAKYSSFSEANQMTFEYVDDIQTTMIPICKYIPYNRKIDEFILHKKLAKKLIKVIVI
jgi:hypothetical protein